MARIAVVGGGISGLALAYRLEGLLPADEVLLLERQAQLGGTIATVRREGYQVECGPNGFLDNNPATLQLCRTVGLSDALVPASAGAGRNRYLFLQGRLHRLPTGLISFLTSPVLSWRAKYRLLTERFRSRRSDPGDESIDSFARRRVGGEIADTLADAFVTGIFAGDPKRLSVQASFPRLANFEREHGSVMAGMSATRKRRIAEARARSEPVRRGGSQLWSLRDGLQQLIDTLRGQLRRPPIAGAAVRRVRRENGAWLVEGEGLDRWTVDRVVLACPAHQQAVMLADLDAELASEINAIPYNRVAVVALGFRQADVAMSLDGFGYLTPQREQRDVLGVQWCSSIYPGRAPDGCILLRAMCGGWSRPEMVDWEDHRLLSAVRVELAAAMGVQAQPLFHHIVRWDRAIPQYHLGHLDRVARIDARLARHPGLFLGGNAYRGVALNDCVEQAGRLAERIAAARA